MDELPVPKQCECENGGICQLDGSCDCGDFEGEKCQKGSTVSRQVCLFVFTFLEEKHNNFTFSKKKSSFTAYICPLIFKNDILRKL